MVHTHRGHCQHCGRLQAVSPRDGGLAKHGYEVKWGYFSGQCGASHRLPMEQDLTHKQALCATLAEQAGLIDARIAKLNSGEARPETVPTYRLPQVKKEGPRPGSWRWETARVPWAEATEHEQNAEVRSIVSGLAFQARGMRDHIVFLDQLAAKVHGQPLPEAPPPPPPPDPNRPIRRRRW